MDFGTHVQGSDSRVCHRLIGSLSDRTSRAVGRAQRMLPVFFVTPIRSLSTTRVERMWVTWTRKHRRGTSTLASKSRRRWLLIFRGNLADQKKAGMNSYIVALFKFKKELLPLVQVVSPMAVDLTALACHPTNTTFRRPSLCSEVSLGQRTDDHSVNESQPVTTERLSGLAAAPAK